PLVPPGNSVTDQYTETLPWVSGDRAGRGDGDRDPRQGLGERNVDLLEGADEDGGEIAAVLASTGPPIAGLTGGGNGGDSGADGGSGAGSGGSGAGAGDGGGPGAGAAALGAAGSLASGDGGGGIGPLMPVLIGTGLIALLALAAALWRARRPETS
ncbi:MAG TPA: hypothetical protein VFD37_07700, partial [Solirubrobacterales bacterium]|nr:hypothetical protein [Solirubrobacterales bacterium]